MPFTVNGFGTSICGSRGNVGWGSQDAMEWLVVFFLPVIPIKPVHTFDWKGSQYKAIPIKWSVDLTLRTFLGGWVWGFGVIGAILLVFAVFNIVKQRSMGLEFLLAATPFIGLGVVLAIALRWSDARNKAIRRVLGANTIGNCDPANLPTDVVEQMAGDPRVAHGVNTFAEAARDYFHRRAYARAMWAARVCVVLEDQAEGESLTDMILHDPEVIEAIEAVRRDAQSWEPLMFAREAQSASEAPERPVDVHPAGANDQIRPA